MEKPFVFIECKTTSRDEFEMTEGRQPTYALFFLKKGSFRIKLDDKENIVKENDCIILPDDIDFFRTVIEPISFIYLKFKINPKCNFKIDVPYGIVRFKNHRRFRDSIEKYEKITEARGAAEIYYREHLLEDILLQAFAEQGAKNSIGSQFESIEDEVERCHDMVAKVAAQYILNNISSKITVDDLCRAASTNQSTLNFKMRKAFSMSSAAYVEHVRMSFARSLLRNTTYTIGEIASRCGYENIYYFSSVFSKCHDSSPTEYRNKYR